MDLSLIIALDVEMKQIQSNYFYQIVVYAILAILGKSPIFIVINVVKIVRTVSRIIIIVRSATKKNFIF
jgi:hypothetical protein